MKILATICARGGSKRTPKKNLNLLAGKPLIAYTVEVALKCKEIGRVVVSTDDGDLAEVARKYGAEVPFIRPKELATDTAPKWPVLQHIVNFLQKSEGYMPDVVVDLDPTSPLRQTRHISECVKMLLDNSESIDGVISMYKADKNPYFNMVEYSLSGYLHLVKPIDTTITRGQDAPKVYSLNASIYALKTKSLMNTRWLFENKLKGYIMDPWAIDIDTPLDFQIAEYLIQKGYPN